MGEDLRPDTDISRRFKCSADFRGVQRCKFRFRFCCFRPSLLLPPSPSSPPVLLSAAADPFTITCFVSFVAAAVVDQAGIASTAAMAHVSAALSGTSAFPGGVAGLPGMSAVPGMPGALGVPGAVVSAAAMAANKVMRELHVGGLPHGVSGVQLQASVVVSSCCRVVVCMGARLPACFAVGVHGSLGFPLSLLFLPLRGDSSRFFRARLAGIAVVLGDSPRITTAGGGVVVTGWCLVMGRNIRR